VVRVALQNATSVAALLITTEAMVAEVPKKNAGGNGMPPGRRHGWYGLLGPTVQAQKKKKGPAALPGLLHYPPSTSGRPRLKLGVT
jgi:hypothetical protein